MPAPEIRLIAVTRADRNEIISEVSDTVASVGGWIEDVNFFSNISVALRFVIPASSGPPLALELPAKSLQIDTQGLTNLDALPADQPGKEVICSLQMTFFHSDSDLRQHIPSVPG